MPSELRYACTVTKIYTNLFQELDIPISLFVTGALRVQLHMYDIIDLINIAILNVWNTDRHLVHKKRKG